MKTSQDPRAVHEAFQRSRRTLIDHAKRTPGSAGICLELLIEMVREANRYGVPFASTHP